MENVNKTTEIVEENATTENATTENTLEVAKENTTANVTESGTTGMFKHTLSRPFDYCGVTYTSFEFDFEKLIGEDMAAIETEMAAIGEFVLSPEISTSFLARMAARAAGVGSDVILKLPIRDFAKIKNESRNFLVSTGF